MDLPGEKVLIRLIDLFQTGIGGALRPWQVRRVETNEKLSTNDFKQKKLILKEEGYQLPDILDEAEELTPEIILENTKRISELARTIIWKV